MQETFEVDLDQEKVYVEGKWLTRVELAGMLTKRLAAMDYNIGVLSQAIEHLDRTLKSLESFSVRLTPEVAAQLRENAGRATLPVSALIRDAIVSYLVGSALSKLA